MSDFVTLLNAVSANGTGPVQNTGRVQDELTIQVTTSGTVAAFSIQLQGSLDGSAWQNIGSAITSTTAGTNVSTGALYKQFQATLSGYSGTGTITCGLAYNLADLGSQPSSSSPLAIASGGTGQSTAAAAYNALSPMTTTGDLEYESGANTAARLAGNTTSTKKFLTQTGNGTVSAAPGWNTIASGDVPTLNQNTTGTASNITGTLDTVPAPAAAVSLNSQKITSLANGVNAQDAAAFGQVSNAWGAVDQGFITWNYDQPSIAAGSGVALTTAGTLYVMAVKLNVAASITNINYYMTTGGSSLTSGQCFAALYQGAGGALLGTTADQSVNFAASGAFKTAAISGGPVAAAAGKLYVAFWFNGTTGPSLARSDSTTTLLNVGLATAASRWGVANTGVTTTAPGTLGTITGNAPAAYWVALS